MRSARCEPTLASRYAQPVARKRKATPVRAPAEPAGDRWILRAVSVDSICDRVRDGDGSKGFRAGLGSGVMFLGKAELTLLDGLRAWSSPTLRSIASEFVPALFQTYNQAVAHSAKHKRCSFVGAQQELAAAWEDSVRFAELRDSFLTECKAILLPSQHPGIRGIERSDALYALRVATALFGRVCLACRDLL